MSASLAMTFPRSRVPFRPMQAAVVATLVLVALAGCGDKAAQKAAAPSAEEQQYIAGEQLWRAQRREGLITPDGWTTLVGLHWLTLKSHYIGSGERSAAEDAVDLFLRELRVLGLCLLDARHQRIEFALVAYGFFQHFQLLTINKKKSVGLSASSRHGTRS